MNDERTDYEPGEPLPLEQIAASFQAEVGRLLVDNKKLEQPCCGLGGFGKPGVK